MTSIKDVRRKWADWSDEDKYSVPKSFTVDGPRPALPKPNRTPFKPAGVSHDQ